MTRKHFRALAAIVRDLPKTKGRVPLDRLINDLAWFCRQQNPRFDEATFRAACFEHKK